jgi:gamma-glutamylcysteine synthetase
MFIRYFGSESFRVGHSFEISGAGGQYMYEFSVPIPIPAKSDIDVRVITRTNNGRYTAAFDIILIKDSLGGG